MPKLLSITPWANRCHGNTVSHFLSIAHYADGMNSVTPAAFRRDFWSAGNNRNLDPRPFESKINKLRQTVEDFYCAKFQVISINGFVLSCWHTQRHTNPPTHTHRDKVIAVSAPPTVILRSNSCTSGWEHAVTERWSARWRFVLPQYFTPRIQSGEGSTCSFSICQSVNQNFYSGLKWYNRHCKDH